MALRFPLTNEKKVCRKISLSDLFRVIDSMNILSPSIVAISGQHFAYNNTFEISQAAYQSGQLMHEFRISQNLGQVRGIEEANEDRYSLCGAMAEIAVYEAYGLPGLNLELGRGADFVSGQWSGDVKCSPTYSNLVVCQRLYNPDWLYLHLRQVAPNRMKFCGWLYGHEVPELADKVLEQDGKPPAWRIKQERLRPFKKFIDLSRPL